MKRKTLLCVVWLTALSALMCSTSYAASYLVTATSKAPLVGTTGGWGGTDVSFMVEDIGGDLSIIFGTDNIAVAPGAKMRVINASPDWETNILDLWDTPTIAAIAIAGGTGLSFGDSGAGSGAQWGFLTDGIAAIPFPAFQYSSTATSSYTYTATLAPVPVPAAIWLLGSGLLGLIGFRRKRSA